MFVHGIDQDTALSLLALRDAEELFTATDANREHLRRWLPWVESVRSVDDTRAFIRSSLDQHARNNGFQCAVRFRHNIVGVVGYHWIDWANRSTHIGYWLAADHQGRGIMTKACRALVDFAFGELELNRVEIATADGNSRSRAIPERLGFVEEGLHRQAERLADRYVDLRLYAMLRSEWDPERRG
jgi:ribosomal-protein-serine acetyltransferase